MLRWIPVLLVLLTLAACPRPRTAADQADELQDLVSPDKLTDPLAAGLASELPDERSFALFFITRFHLPGYHEPLTVLAASDTTAAVACAVVYNDLEPLRAQMRPASSPGAGAQAQPWDPTSMLGAIYGLRCAHDLPPELWTEALPAVTPDQLGDLLWGIAQLDAEPGGPLKRSEALKQAIVAPGKLASQDHQLQAIAATDALLGGEQDWRVDWQRYIELAPQVDWTSVQWTALLRWAPPEVWRAILERSNLDDPARLSLAQALAAVGAPGVVLPGSVESWELNGAGVEYRACLFTAGQSKSIPLPELDQLKQNTDPAAEAGLLGSLLQALKYAALHDDTQAIEATLQALPNLSDAARSGILATLERFGPAGITDAQLGRLAGLRDPITAYWLVLGWPERKPVQDAELDTLLRVSKGDEDIMLAHGYTLWKEQATQMKRKQTGG